MGHKVALSFEDGVTKVIKVGDYETVMDAAYKARINIPSDCRDGACGTCKAFCDSGSFDPGDYIDDAMTEEELEKGYMLTCQAVPESDLAIQIPATSESAKTVGHHLHFHREGAQQAFGNNGFLHPGGGKPRTPWPSSRASTSTSKSPEPTRSVPIRSAAAPRCRTHRSWCG